jgi:D-glycero-D-manno-heptose 1,7-bisphosphate phosphatase
MLKRAARELGLNLVASWMIGDKLSDVLAGYNAGCRSIRLRTGKGRSISPGAGDPGLAEHTIVDDLLAAANLILSSDPFPSGGSSDDTGGAIPTR